MSKQLIIQKVVDSDIKTILEIEKECNLAEWSANDYRQEIIREDSLVLCARIVDQTVGFLIVRRTSDDELDLLNFGVSKRYQRQGIGSALWNELLKQAVEERPKLIWLEVRKSNFGAIEFYKSRGFIETQLRKNFYTRPPEDARVMKLEL